MSSLSTPAYSTVYLKDYTPLPFLLPKVHLTFHLDPKSTRVTGIMHFEHKENKEDQPLTLQGEKLKLLSIKLEGKTLSPDLYQQSASQLEIFKVPQNFVLEIEVEISPEANKELDGLYASKDILCTQNEPEGFRRIMYFFDRPDNMSVFTTTLIAKKDPYPQLLSNGNQIEALELKDGYHQVTWEDPFPKPCYLFALVAGNLGKVEDHFITQSGRKILLEIYSDKGNEHRLHHAMLALKNSMKWDEERFGLEYDLDIYMIVAVDSFNMGAMENKGLNIFNSSCTLAHSQTATDDDFLRVEGVIAHEYFHNWTGNRVTCRDWFQLTLKEGLTVFRDQEFSSDMNDRAVVRIEEVNKLKTFQFAEDAGPTSHPIKPSSYQQINNFYTATVYDKGSEVIRMIHTLIGEEKFRKGIDKYFELYDGQAVTTEDFIHAMQEASGFDFSQFTHWYHQKGTPVVQVEQCYEEKENTYTLTLKQQPTKENSPALLIPLKVALFSEKGEVLEKEKLLLLNDWEKSFSFSTPSSPLLSINRNFTAPIHLHTPLDAADYLKLLSCENDPYNLWECTQHLASHWIEKNIQAPENLPSSEYYQGLKSIIEHPSFAPSFKALALTLPSLSLITDQQSPPQFEASHQALKQLRQSIAQQLEKIFLAYYQNLSLHTDNSPSPKAIGIRKLKNTCLHYLCSLESYQPLAFEQFKHAQNMTCELAALKALVYHQAPQAKEALDRFYQKWHQETLVIQKWFALQALCPSSDTLAKVKILLQDPAFDLHVPNIMRALIGSFANNPLCFNNPDGSGYAFIGEMIQKVDAFNPQMGAALAKTFKRFKKLDNQRKNAMKQVLNDLIKTPGLSKNSFEIIDSCLMA